MKLKGRFRCLDGSPILWINANSDNPSNRTAYMLEPVTETGRGNGAGSVFGGARRGGENFVRGEAGRVTDAKRRGEAGVS